MADADKTTAEADLTPLPDQFATPCTIASKNRYGGWAKKDLPVSGAGTASGPGKNISGDRD